MKKLFAISVLALTLSGCAVPKFDNIEYNHFVELTTWTQRARTWCGEPLAMVAISDELVHRARNIEIYTSYRPARGELKETATLVRANLEELQKAYTSKSGQPSTAYCLGKLTIVENSLKRALPVIGDLQE
jgi:hypothetical protein